MTNPNNVLIIYRSNHGNKKNKCHNSSSNFNICSIILLITHKGTVFVHFADQKKNKNTQFPNLFKSDHRNLSKESTTHFPQLSQNQPTSPYYKYALHFVKHVFKCNRNTLISGSNYSLILAFLNKMIQSPEKN